ncbi:sulfite exporter TauE/SafE family protein [Nicoliella lavandulae]|uniref:Probable membrane transporter protein n=1 Tax=Nicoliella lavandulae TaxID=3082954 RepID=A0ABU8SIX8_9LACO
MFILLLVLGFIIGGFVIAMGGGGAAFYLGILTGLVHIAPASAAATSLFTALPSLCIGAYSHYRTGNMRFKFGNRMLIAAVPATIIGSIIAEFLDENIYKWLIFLVFLLLGLQVIWQSFHHHESKNTQMTAQLNPGKAYFFGTLSGLMVGIAGLSGGSPLVAGMLLMGLSMQEAAATSSYALIITSIVGILMHSTEGNIAWGAGIALMIGAIIGSALMPALLSRFNSRKVTKVLRPLMGAIMIIMAVTTVA